MMNQKNRPRSNNGSRNKNPSPNPQNMGILSFSMSILSVVATWAALAVFYRVA